MATVTYILISLFLKFSIATIDVTLNEFQYLSDRLTLPECRRLVASLYSEDFMLSDALESSLSRLPDVSCLDLLMEWYGEGGREEGLLARRLSQIGRADLSTWLSTAVFQDLTRGLQDAVLDSNSNHADKVDLPEVGGDVEQNPWTEIDMDLSNYEHEEKLFDESDDAMEKSLKLSALLSALGVIACALWAIIKKFCGNDDEKQSGHRLPLIVLKNDRSRDSNI